MSYSFLGEDLHEVADSAKEWFQTHYAATHFLCEQEVDKALPLKPTWQARMKTGYTLCLNVQPTPFSPTLHEFVTKCASKGLPIKLWVAVGSAASKESFGAELKQAHGIGIGVLQALPGEEPHEYHRPVPLSLFGLSRSDPKGVPAKRRETIKSAEDTFLGGSPDQGCQAICQELESITRVVAQHTYDKGWWRTPKGSAALKARFFTTDSWANLLREFETRVEVGKVRAKADAFDIHEVVRARAFTDWRNQVSHKPKSLEELKKRDKKLRTMFEATRDLLLDWYTIARPFGVIS